MLMQPMQSIHSGNEYKHLYAQKTISILCDTLRALRWDCTNDLCSPSILACSRLQAWPAMS